MTVEFTQEQFNAIIKLVDIAIKAGGIQVLNDAVLVVSALDKVQK